MLTLLALTALLQAPPAPLLSAEVPLPSLEATAPSPSEPREVTQLAAFVGKNLLSWDFTTQSTSGLKMRQGARSFAITDDLSEPLHLVPEALKLALSAQRDYQTGITLLWVGGGGAAAGLVMELVGLALLGGPGGLILAVVGVSVALLSLIPLFVSMRSSTDAVVHFSESLALYNHGLVELRPVGAVSSELSAPPLLRF